MKIKTPKSGLSHQISLQSGDHRVLISNILLGEVWIASGQSNMQMNLNGYRNEPIKGANDAIAKSDNSKIEKEVKKIMKEKISSSPIFSIVSRILFGPIIIFGLYVQFHGDYGPGGGFQAGVIFASSFILYGIIFGVKKLRSVVNPTIVSKEK